MDGYMRLCDSRIITYAKPAACGALPPLLLLLLYAKCIYVHKDWLTGRGCGGGRHSVAPSSYRIFHFV